MERGQDRPPRRRGLRGGLAVRYLASAFVRFDQVLMLRCTYSAAFVLRCCHCCHMLSRHDIVRVERQIRGLGSIEAEVHKCIRAGDPSITTNVLSFDTSMHILNNLFVFPSIPGGVCSNDCEALSQGYEAYELIVADVGQHIIEEQELTPFVLLQSAINYL